MNEDLKNIETCLPESILAEVANCPTDAQFVSLVNEALDPLKQQAFQQAGSDAYDEVVDQHKPYTFTSAVVQMKSNIILLLRRLWRFPFGSGTLPSLADAASLRSFADMWSHYIDRLSGNETYGIPSRLSSLTDLPSAPLLVSDRKISEPNAIEGMSLAQIMCSSYAPTKIYDNNSGWTMSKNLPWSHLTELVLGCEWATSGVTVIKDQDVEDVVLPNLKGLPANQPGGYNYSLTLISGSPNVKRIYAPKLVHTGGYQYIYIVSDLQYLEELDLPSYEEFWTSYGYGIASNCPALKKINMPKYKYNNSNSGLFKDLPALEEAYLQSITDLSHHSCGGCSVNNCPELHTLVLGVMTSSNAASLTGCPKLLHLEFAGVTGSIDISGWSPTLDSSNLQQFLQNFRDYIALRLTDNGSGKTLTLSQAVFSAIWDANGDPQVYQDSPEMTQCCADIDSIMTTKQWEVNKAS